MFILWRERIRVWRVRARTLSRAIFGQRQWGPMAFSPGALLGLALMVAFVIVAIPLSMSHVINLNSKYPLNILGRWYYRVELFFLWFGTVEVHQLLHARGQPWQPRVRFWGVRLGETHRQHTGWAVFGSILILVVLLLATSSLYATSLAISYLIWVVLAMVLVDLLRQVWRRPLLQTALAGALANKGVVKQRRDKQAPAAPSRPVRTNKSKAQQRSRSRNKRKRR